MCLGGRIMSYKAKQSNIVAREAARSLGEKTYQGMDCNQNHGGIRYVAQGACVICTKRHAKDFRDAHPGYHNNEHLTPEQLERNKETQKRYVSRNKETIAAYQKEYHETYKTKQKEIT